jgi:polyhydroxybutyrate depolymerase
MDSRGFSARVNRLASRLLPIVLFSLALWLPSTARSVEQCDHTGFDKPCAVHDGEYLALIPEGEGPFPVMVYLYGSGGQAATVANHPLFIESVVDRGYALIVPAALNMQYRRGVYDTGWALRHEPGGSRDEVQFIEQVIEDAGRRFSIDRDQVVLVGQSRGAFLIWEIACHEPKTAAAYAVHAGGYLGTLPTECEQPVRFLHSHGLVDPIVPYTGIPVVSGGVAMAPIERSLDLLAETNNCSKPEADEASLVLGMQRTQWTDCARGGSLDLLLHEGGHTMPSEWFRAVLDWFEETPAEIEEIKPGIRTVGARLPGQFKTVPTGGAALTSAGKSAAGRRLKAPSASKKASE